MVKVVSKVARELVFRVRVSGVTAQILGGLVTCRQIRRVELVRQSESGAGIRIGIGCRCWVQGKVGGRQRAAFQVEENAVEYVGGVFEQGDVDGGQWVAVLARVGAHQGESVGEQVFAGWEDLRGGELRR